MKTPRGWLSAPPNRCGMCSPIPVAVRRECDHSAATLWREGRGGSPGGIGVWEVVVQSAPSTPLERRLEPKAYSRKLQVMRVRNAAPLLPPDLCDIAVD